MKGGGDASRRPPFLHSFQRRGTRSPPPHGDVRLTEVHAQVVQSSANWRLGNRRDVSTSSRLAADTPDSSQASRE